jgi:hypothetical protein
LIWAVIRGVLTGFEFFQPGARLNVLRDDIVDGLSICERSQQSRTEAHR